MTDLQQAQALNFFASLCHTANHKWWRNPRTGRRIKRNKGELLMLVVTELAEALEGERKDLMDTHLKHRKMVEVEIADALIRLFDYVGGFGIKDVGGAFVEKLAYNARRRDHTAKARLGKHGKRF